MPLISVDLQAGTYRNGTQYQAKGRWYDANLVRFFEGSIRPWGGWNAHSASTVTGTARALLPWIDPTAIPWIATASESKVYVYTRSGAQTDITPAGLSAGRADALLTAGYGGGTYGTSTYGDAHGGSTSLLDASVWTLDQLEGLLVGVMAEDGKLWSWDNNTANDFTQPAGSPTSNRAVFVTDEGFVTCLGAGGDNRTVKWADQGSLTSWTPSDTNQAGSYVLQTNGKLMNGVRMAGANVLFTSTDVHIMKYAGVPNIYEFTQVGTGCGIVGQAAFAKATDFVAWMSVNGFWLYNGQVQPIDCPIADDVFRNMNTLQRSKCWAIHNSTFSEIIWFYPASTGNEISNYAIWNYRENHWTNGTLARTCGYEAGVFQWPLMVGTGAGGTVYQHENGFSRSGAGTIYVESGPLELGEGETVYDILGLEPDALTLGDVSMIFYSRWHAVEADRTSATFSCVNPISVRVAGREHRVRAIFAGTAEERLGKPRLDVRSTGGLR